MGADYPDVELLRGCPRSSASRAAGTTVSRWSKNGPQYLRWAPIEAATRAARHPAFRARVDIARELSTATWPMLTKREPFAPAGPTCALCRLTAQPRDRSLRFTPDHMSPARLELLARGAHSRCAASALGTCREPVIN